uniref:Uncharacterized protein n=1 Tax=Cacopsylla melanoneura TaxID=428564 RepID=A0A8D8VQ57_9HEMI
MITKMTTMIMTNTIIMILLTRKMKINSVAQADLMEAALEVVPEEDHTMAVPVVDLMEAARVGVPKEDHTEAVPAVDMEAALVTAPTEVVPKEDHTAENESPKYSKVNQLGCNPGSINSVFNFIPLFEFSF